MFLWFFDMRSCCRDFCCPSLTWFEWFIFEECAEIWQVWAVGTVWQRFPLAGSSSTQQQNDERATPLKKQQCHQNQRENWPLWYLPGQTVGGFFLRGAHSVWRRAPTAQSFASADFSSSAASVPVLEKRAMAHFLLFVHTFIILGAFHFYFCEELNILWICKLNQGRIST